MTEAELQEAVIELAGWYGYLIHHDRPARTKDGTWKTHIQGTPGFPDLVLAHPDTGHIIFAELKSKRGKTTDNQAQWLRALAVPSNNDRLDRTRTFLWTPDDWGPGGGTIAEALKAGATSFRL